MDIVETWYFQIWVNFGGMADRRLANVQPKNSLGSHRQNMIIVQTKSHWIIKHAQLKYIVKNKHKTNSIISSQIWWPLNCH